MRYARICKLFAAFTLLSFVSAAHAGMFGGKEEGFKEENLSKLKKNDVKRIVVPYFKVNVHTKLNKTSKASGSIFGGGAKAKASMFVEWSDPDTKMLQQVADDAWKTFEKQLTAAGYEVVPMSKVIGSAAFKQLNGSTQPVQSDNMLSLAPSGMKLYDPMGKIDPNGSFFLGMGNMNGKLESDIAREILGSMDGVAIARITVNLAPGDFDAEGGGHYDGSASASVGFVSVLTVPATSPTVTPELTGIELQTNFDSAKLPNGTEFSAPKDFTRLQLNALVRGEGQVSKLEETTTKTEKGAAAGVALFGALMGQSAGMEAGKFVAHVDGKAFRAESQKEIGKLAEQIEQKIAIGK